MSNSLWGVYVEDWASLTLKEALLTFTCSSGQSFTYPHIQSLKLMFQSEKLLTWLCRKKKREEERYTAHGVSPAKKLLWIKFIFKEELQTEQLFQEMAILCPLGYAQTMSTD